MFCETLLRRVYCWGVVCEDLVGESVEQVLFGDPGVNCFHVLFYGMFCGKLRVGVKVCGVVIVLEYCLLFVSRISWEVRKMM